MTEFKSINQFGSLTINGQRISFQNFDKDNDGKITKEEYNSLLNEIQLDTVEFSMVNNNEDNVITEDEFGLWEQKIAMQDAVNSMASQISRDFCGNKAQYIQSVLGELKDYIESFASSFTGDINGMADAFKDSLPNKYAEIKSTVLANDPSVIKSKVLDEVATDLISSTREAGKSLPANAIKKFAVELEKEADKFMKTYTGTNLEEDLKIYLENFFNISEATVMQEASNNFKSNTENLGPVYDSNDFEIIKEYAKEFLQTAISNEITLKLGGVNINSAKAIDTALSKFKDAEDILNAINEIIDNLSTQTKKEQIIAEEETKANEIAFKEFAKTKGSEYTVDAEIIDWSKVDSRYFDGGDIYCRGKGWGGSRDLAYNEGSNLLKNDKLKNQIKAQIETMLASKGISFEKVEEVFENVYNQTVIETLNAESMITGRGARGFSSKGEACIDVKTLCDTFVTNFNANMTKAIDEMNSSNTDMDLIDLDFDELNEIKDKDGNPVKSEIDFAASYANGTKIEGSPIDIKFKALHVVHKMQAQLLNKARNMCNANGVEFDKAIFDTIFNNASATALSKGIARDSFRKSSLNTRLLINTLTAEFKTNYTNWVEKKK